MRSTFAAEARIYWLAMKGGLIAHRAGLDAGDFIDELEAIALHTTWPRLKTMCYAGMILLAGPAEALACGL